MSCGIMGSPERGELVIDQLLGTVDAMYLTQKAAQANKEAESLKGWARKLELEGNCGPELMKE